MERVNTQTKKTFAALLFSLSTTAKEFNIEHIPQSIEFLKIMTQIKRMTNEKKIFLKITSLHTL